MPTKKPSSPTPHELFNFQERAAFMEYDGNLSREDAEDKAWKIVFGNRFLKQDFLQFFGPTFVH